MEDTMHTCMAYFISMTFHFVFASSVCAECPAGFYISSPCTETSDRECSPCSSCAEGEFRVAACSALRDTDCKGETENVRV
jgi:hypothetical protein